MTYIKLSGYLLIIPCVIIFCCIGTAKNSSSQLIQDDWTINRPISDDYYIGIGSAKNTGDPGDVQAAARNQARADISSQIRVHVTSVEGVFDSSVESDSKHSYTSSYYSKISTFTESILEGVEIAETKYTPDGNYWVKMKLNKEAYRAKCNEQVNRAKSITIDAMRAAETADPIKKIYELNTALEAIDGFKSTLLTYRQGDKDFILNTEILRRLRQTLDDIQLKPATPELTIGALDSLADTIGFNVTYQNIPIVNCPLTWSASNTGITLLALNERQQGFYPIMISGLSASVGRISIAATIDLSSIRDNLENRGLQLPKGSFVLARNKPSVFPSGKEEFLESLVNELLNSKTFSMASKAETADYIIKGMFTFDPEVSIRRSIFQASGVLECTLFKQGIQSVLEIRQNITSGSGRSKDAAIQALKKQAIDIAVKEINQAF